MTKPSIRARFTRRWRSTRGPVGHSSHREIDAVPHTTTRPRIARWGRTASLIGPAVLSKYTSTPSGQSVATRSEEHTSELQSLMRISYAVFCLKKKNKIQQNLKKATKPTQLLHQP